MRTDGDSPTVMPAKTVSNERSEASKSAIIPLCDVAGYSCFVAWAFVLGWSSVAIPVGFADADSCCLLRAMLFAGVAFGALIHFLVGRLSITKSKALHAAACCLLCLCPAVTFFVSLNSWLVFLLWLLGGFGQAGFFFIWGSRFRALERRQQLHAICGAFIFGGLTLMLASFTDRLAALLVLSILPVASLVFLASARRRWSGKVKPLANPDDAGNLIGSVRGSLKKQIPFRDDRKIILLKGLFSLLYSIFLGFATCAALSGRFWPFSEVAIGLGNVVAAYLMLVLLRGREWERRICDTLPKFFLAITSVCCLALGVLWPADVVLVCLSVLFVLFGCYEIVSAHTAYVYSEYDAVRCLWEINSSKAGNSIGFFLGWIAAAISLYRFNVDSISLTVACFSMVVFAVVVDTIFFKDLKTKFQEVIVEDEPVLKIFDAELIKSFSQDKGRWSRVCEDLSEKYKLSPRQKEVFILLAKGRNVQFIKDKLVLSTPTVKSHVYSIYQKMGVHSHQELLDLVETEAKNHTMKSS